MAKKIMRPEIKHLLILDERSHIFSGLIHVEPVDCIKQQVIERCW